MELGVGFDAEERIRQSNWRFVFQHFISMRMHADATLPTSTTHSSSFVR